MRSGTLNVFDLTSRRKLRDLPAGREPDGLAVSPDGCRLWVADRLGHSVSVLDTATFARLADLPTGETPIRVAVSPDGRRVVTSNFGAGTLSEFDARTLKPLRTIALGSPVAQQVTILFSADGRHLSVAETSANKVAELAWPEGGVLRRLSAGKNGDGLGLSPIRSR